MLLPFASLSIHKLIGSVGNGIGFASIIAVAILVVLYFAHARETTALREQLEESQQHIAGLEARIAQLVQGPGRGMRRAPAPGGAMSAPPAPVVPAAVPVRPVVSPPPTVRRVPSPATAAASAGPASALNAAPAVRGAGRPELSGRNGAGAPAAAAGTGAPALASATRFVPAPATANGAARAAGAPPRIVGPFPSRPAPRPVGAAAAAGVPAGAASPRRLGSRPLAPGSFPLLEEEPLGPGWLSGRLLPVAIGAVAVLVIVVGLIVILSSGGTTTVSASNKAGASRPASSSQAGTVHGKHQTPAVFDPAHVAVAVMNGTTQAGLAADVGAKLATDGYKQGNITNAASQTEQLSYVYYLAGKDRAANLQAAKHVAKALGLGAARVLPASPAVLTSCAISASGASLGSCSANVVVSLGQDRVSLATSAAAG